MRLNDFDYHLPEELIAQRPTDARGESRLLYLDGETGRIEDAKFRDLERYLRPGDVMVFNNTRVIKARLFGHKESGGAVELLVERVLDPGHVLVQMRFSHPPREGTRIALDGDVMATVLERRGEFFRIRFEDKSPVFAILERVGQLPLPPYISRPPEAHDETRYQTVFAREPGAVAAPTAGLHFDDEILSRLKEAGIRSAYVTLHVGAGTFQPVRAENVAEHEMHSEWYHVPPETAEAVAAARAGRGRVIAVGTTTLRALESAASGGELVPGHGETSLFILPGYRFRVAERLVTNFHLPKSTLLMLVSAFGGADNIRRAYQHAVEQRYRFLSYGDAMMIERA
jgi:S-adenosylmethionine:tRNA ribosyltransferase-isomerase